MARFNSVLMISQLFNPDFGGLSTRAYGLARLFKSLGFRVTILTTVPHYPDGYPKNYREDNEFELIRLRLRLIPYKGFLNRMVNFSFFPLVCCEKLFNSHNEYDIAVSIGFNPFSAIPLRLNGIKYIMDLSDLWPETIALKVKNPLLRLTLQLIGRMVNKFVYEKSIGFILLNPNMYRLLKEFYNLKSIKWTWIVNPANEDLFRPVKNREKVREKLEIDQDSFIILYHGTFGVLQGLPKVVEAFGKAINFMRGDKRPVLYLIGNGEEYSKIMKVISKLSPRVRAHIKVLPRMSRKAVANYVRIADLGLVPINAPNALIYIVTPVKSMEYLASGIPILAPKGSFIGNDVVRVGAGFLTDFRDVDETVKSLIEAYRVLNKEEQWHLYSNSAIELYSSKYSMDIQRKRLSKLLEEL